MRVLDKSEFEVFKKVHLGMLNKGSLFIYPTDTIYGIGLAYAKHINETASDFDPQGDPPVFIKASNSIAQNGSTVKIPAQKTMLNAIERLEPGISKQVNQQVDNLPALLDYEVELGFVLLEDIGTCKIDCKVENSLILEAFAYYKA